MTQHPFFFFLAAAASAAVDPPLPDAAAGAAAPFVLAGIFGAYTYDVNRDAH